MDSTAFGRLLDGGALHRLESLGGARSFATGAWLVREGSPSEEVFLLRQGRVKIVAVGTGGREALLDVRGAGDLVGEMSAIDGGSRSASAVAMEPVDACAIATSTFIAFLEG